MHFAGHPVIGLGHVLFRGLLVDLPVSGTAEGEGFKSQTVITKAGPVGIHYNPGSQIVSAEIPHNVHLHSKPVPVENLVRTQLGLQAAAKAGRLRTEYPVLSIVKGVTYVLADLTDAPEVFAGIAAGPSPTVDLDEGWSPSFAGVMYYRHIGSAHVEQGTMVQQLRVRMIAIDLEDPACGSGSAALAAYLSLQGGSGNGKHRYIIDQGSEIERQSNITVEVLLNERGDGISSILLAGQAALVTEGRIHLPE